MSIQLFHPSHIWRHYHHFIIITSFKFYYSEEMITKQKDSSAYKYFGKVLRSWSAQARLSHFNNLIGAAVLTKIVFADGGMFPLGFIFHIHDKRSSLKLFILQSIHCAMHMLLDCDIYNWFLGYHCDWSCRTLTFLFLYGFENVFIVFPFI